MALDVPNRAHDPRRTVNFYTSSGDYSHTADVRWLNPRGYRSGRPHAAELNKHLPPMGEWAVPEFDNNPNRPKEGQ